MTLDGARRDVAVLALLQARSRLDTLARILRSRTAWSGSARRMLAIVDVIAPLLTAVESIVPDAMD